MEIEKQKNIQTTDNLSIPRCDTTIEFQSIERCERKTNKSHQLNGNISRLAEQASFPGEKFYLAIVFHWGGSTHFHVGVLHSLSAYNSVFQFSSAKGRIVFRKTQFSQ